MLRRIATPHPALVFTSLALTSGLIWYSLRSNLEKPEPWVGTIAVVSIACLCERSKIRRSRKIDREISQRSPRVRYPIH